MRSRRFYFFPLIAFVFWITLSRAGSALPWVIAIEKQSFVGVEQVSLTLLEGDEVKWTQNSNFVTASLPARLGIYQKEKATEWAQRMRELRQSAEAERFSLSPTVHRSEHRWRVWIAGKEIPQSSKLFDRVVELMVEISKQEDWRAVDGEWVTTETPLGSCFSLGVKKSVCSARLGWVHVYR